MGQKIRALDKVIQTIERACVEKDLPRVIEQVEKYNQVLRKENAQKQKDMQREQLLKEKESKERERVEAREKER